MPNKMERFTQRARRVLMFAQEEAERFQHNYIGTEHLLIGLFREEEGVAARVLHGLGAEQGRVAALVAELSPATPRSRGSQLDLASDTKRVLELAVDEARRMGHHYIGTEHLLLGLVRLPEGVAIDVLKRLGIGPEEVRRQTRQVLEEQPPASMPSTSPSPVARTSPPPPIVRTGGTVEGFTYLQPLFGEVIADASFQCDVYMMMPYLDALQPVYAEHVRPVVESYDLAIKRADDFFSSHDMIREIWTCIYNARFVIADCTGKNPNVFYELGIVNTLGKEFILLTQNLDDLPFAVRGRRALVYTPTPEGLAALNEQLRAAIDRLLNAGG